MIPYTDPYICTRNLQNTRNMKHTHTHTIPVAIPPRFPRSVSQSAEPPWTPALRGDILIRP